MQINTNMCTYKSKQNTHANTQNITNTHSLTLRNYKEEYYFLSGVRNFHKNREKLGKQWC